MGRIELHISALVDTCAPLTTDALSAMWFYATLACDVETTRVIMSWSIAQSKDLGIHKEDALLASSYSPADRADLMFVQVLYSH